MSGTKKVNVKISNDLIERLNFHWTFVIVLVFGISLGIMRSLFIKSLISCWTPAQFEAQHDAYTHEACWSSKKLIVTDPSINIHPESIPSNVFSLPISTILLAMLLGFKIPHLVRFGFEALIDRTGQIAQFPGSMNQTVQELSLIVQGSIQRRSFLRSAMFTTVKLLILLNLLIQFSFLTGYFHDITIRGIVEVRNSTGDYENITVERTLQYIFPKVVQCPFEIRQLRNVHQYLVQCTLPVNHLYEVFFNVFWFWILMLGIITLFGFFSQLSFLVIHPLLKMRFANILTGIQLHSQKPSMNTLLHLIDIEKSYGLVVARKVAAVLDFSTLGQKKAETEGINRDIVNVPLINIEHENDGTPGEKETHLV